MKAYCSEGPAHLLHECVNLALQVRQIGRAVNDQVHLEAEVDLLERSQPSCQLVSDRIVCLPTFLRGLGMWAR